MNAPNPTPQVALVGEARARRDFSQAGSPLANKLDRTLQSQTHDVTVRSHPDRSREHASEVEWAAPRYFRERRDFDGLVQMGKDIVSEPLEHVFAQHASCRGLDFRSVTS